MMIEWQQRGWPLGLQPLNLRIDLVRNVDFSGSLSLSTLITTSPTSSCSSSSSSSSSELDTEFTGSFFRDGSTTLGSLIGIASLFEMSNRSLRRRSENSLRIKKKRNGNNRAAKHWFSSLCTKAQLSGEVAVAGSASSLGHFLEAERRANDAHRTSRRADVAIAYELEELAPGGHSGSEPNSLFSDGRILPPASNRDGRNDLVGVGNANTELNSSQSGISEGFWGLRSIHCFALLSPCMSGHVAE